VQGTDAEVKEKSNNWRKWPISQLVQDRWPSRRRVDLPTSCSFFRAESLAFEPGSSFPSLPFLSFFLSALMAILSVRFFCLAAMLAATCFLRSSHSFLLLTFSCSARLTAFFQLRYVVLDFRALHPCPCLVPLVLFLDRFAFVGGKVGETLSSSPNCIKACFGSEAVLSFLGTFTGASASAEKATVVVEGTEVPFVCGFEEEIQYPAQVTVAT
jgi:hypothetical protein